MKPYSLRSRCHGWLAWLLIITLLSATSPTLAREQTPPSDEITGRSAKGALPSLGGDLPIRPKDHRAPPTPEGNDPKPTDERPDLTAKRAATVLRGGLPTSRSKDRAYFSEDFEAGIMPPSGWSLIQTNPNETWLLDYSPSHSGLYNAAIFFDEAFLDQDEILLSPTFNADIGWVSFWSFGSLYWCRDTFDNCNLEVWFVNGNWGGSDDIFLGNADDDWSDSWEWSYSFFDISAYAEGTPARIALRYTGNDGAEVGVDDFDITFDTFSCNDSYEPNDTPEEATVLSYSDTLTDTDICPASDLDYYVFSGSAGDIIDVQIDAADSGSWLDSILRLYDSDGVTELAMNDDFTGLDSRLTYTLPEDGDYYLRVEDYSHPDYGGSEFFYSLSLSLLTETAEGPLVADFYLVDDDPYENSLGDDDGEIDCGEIDELYVVLLNQGSQTAYATEATISSTDPYITWLYNTSSIYGDLPGGEDDANYDDFDILIDADTPDGHLIQFDMVITAANGGPWYDSFEVPVVCSGDGQAEWTFMVYMDGDNNLEGMGIQDFMEMSSIGSSDKINILVQFDRIPGWDATYGNWTSTKRFLVTQGMEPTTANALQDLGEANMGDDQTLINFAQWGMANFPAHKYALVLWDHGSGWRYSMQRTPLLKDVAFDDSNGGDALDMLELRQALDTLTDGGANPIDLLGLDACLMAMVEVDTQFIPYAKVRVGSEESEPGNGWPYDALLEMLAGDPLLSVNDLGEAIVDEYYASYGNYETQSAVNLGAPYGSLITAVDDFALALMAGLPGHKSEIVAALENTQSFDYPEYVDLYDLADQVSLSVDDAAIDAAASSVMDAVDNATLQEHHGASWPGAHGVSIYFPAPGTGYDDRYDGDQNWLQFTAATHWDEWLHAFSGAPLGDFTTFLPLVTKDYAPISIYGYAKVTGIGQAGVDLSLDIYNGSEWSTVDTTTTGAGGLFNFTPVKILNPGELYQVTYENPGDPGRLWSWYTRELSSTPPGSKINIGEFDLANIPLLSPADGAQVSLPHTFRWTPRPATISDSYEWDLYNDYVWWWTDPLLGYVGQYTLNSLPSGFSPGDYYWEVWVYAPDGGYGISYDLYAVTITNSGRIVNRRVPDLRVSLPKRDRSAR